MQVNGTYSSPGAAQPYARTVVTPQLVWLEPDIGGTPGIWFADKHGHAVMWGDAPISEVLADRVVAWQDMWEATAYLGNPWPSPAVREGWLREGDELVVAIRSELSPLGCDVIGKFRDVVDSDIPSPSRHRE